MTKEGAKASPLKVNKTPNLNDITVIAVKAELEAHPGMFGMAMQKCLPGVFLERSERQRLVVLYKHKICRRTDLSKHRRKAIGADHSVEAERSDGFNLFSNRFGFRQLRPTFGRRYQFSDQIGRIGLE